MKRRHYADVFGPTTGDKVRLGDAVSPKWKGCVYGDECKFGGSKSDSRGMGQAAGVGDKRTRWLRDLRLLMTVDWAGFTRRTY